MALTKPALIGTYTYLKETRAPVEEMEEREFTYILIMKRKIYVVNKSRISEAKRLESYLRGLHLILRWGKLSQNNLSK